MRHMIVLVAALGLGGAVLLVSGALLASVAHAPTRSGNVFALFPPDIDAAAMLAAVVAADGLPVRETVLPFAIEVAGEAPGLADRLRGAGAWLVLPALPPGIVTLGGCSFLPAEHYDLRMIPARG